MNKTTKEELIKKAKEARKKAYTPYSHFPVGAALLTKEGKVFTGANIENASFSLTNCAERTAIFKAVSEGYRQFEALAVVADSERPISPCGACRQVINEFAEDMPVIMTNLKGDVLELKSSELLPGAFNRKDMD
ncbi:MAG: cytidine deaminase [Halanaerobiales bacterium]|nr:cytidine deaminase [Halanaerobiales bacterium]